MATAMGVIPLAPRFGSLLVSKRIRLFGWEGEHGRQFHQILSMLSTPRMWFITVLAYDLALVTLWHHPFPVLRMRACFNFCPLTLLCQKPGFVHLFISKWTISNRAPFPTDWTALPDLMRLNLIISPNKLFLPSTINDQHNVINVAFLW